MAKPTDNINPQTARRGLKLGRWLMLTALIFSAVGSSLFAGAQYNKTRATPPAPPPPPLPLIDSIMLPSPVMQTVPQGYEELMGRQFANDLATPSNVRTVTDYDPETGCYVIRTQVGDMDITTPFILTPQQYNDWQTRQSMQAYYRKRNSEALTQKEKLPFDILDMNFALGPLEKIFGPGGVSL
ncbi:MAG: hypothetical protein K2L85_10245, partial [Paramuribaculum sp.]|nr:hypothetical protein [Paramuribaculum sp.]